MADARAHGSASIAADLAGFYDLHADIRSDPYLAGKSTLASSRRELADAFGKVRSALDGARTILDWGCRHGVFGWLARRQLGADVGIWGCDVCPPGDYAALHAASGLHYAQLAHPWLLPYADNSFDVVIGGGTLEHVANDGASLSELWRVLAPGGRLVLTHLPNAVSISEWWSRRFSPAHAHPRRYRLASLRERLLQLGFLPIDGGWHQVLPSGFPGADRRPALARSVDRLYGLNGLLEQLWPINRFGTTLWLIAEKRLGF